MFLALHECGHVSKWRVQSSAPQPGEELTCFYCHAATRVKELVGPWRVRCHDCRRVNGHATLRKSCVSTATAHVQEWDTHRVWVWQYGAPDSRILITKAEVGTQPPLFSDAPF